MKNFFYEGYYLHFSAWTVNYEGGINRRGLIRRNDITTLYSEKYKINNSFFNIRNSLLAHF